jgi:hypothetical protein
LDLNYIIYKSYRDDRLNVSYMRKRKREKNSKKKIDKEREGEKKSEKDR